MEYLFLGMILNSLHIWIVRCILKEGTLNCAVDLIRYWCFTRHFPRVCQQHAPNSWAYDNQGYHYLITYIVKYIYIHPHFYKSTNKTFPTNITCILDKTKTENTLLMKYSNNYTNVLYRKTQTIFQPDYQDSGTKYQNHIGSVTSYEW